MFLCVPGLAIIYIYICCLIDQQNDGVLQDLARNVLVCARTCNYIYIYIVGSNPTAVFIIFVQMEPLHVSTLMSWQGLWVLMMPVDACGAM